MKSGPFNFYQQISGIVFNEGSPTPFGLFFNNLSGFYGVYFPKAYQNKPIIYAYNDGDIAPTRFSIKESGSVDNVTPGKFSFSYIQSGQIYSSQPDYYNYSIQESGKMTGVSPDISFLNFNFSSALNFIDTDIKNLNINIIGNIDNCPLDLTSYREYYAGQVVDDIVERLNFSSNIVGNIRPTQKDKEYIAFDLQEIIFRKGSYKIGYTDTGNLSFNMSSITFSRTD